MKSTNPLFFLLLLGFSVRLLMSCSYEEMAEFTLDDAERLISSGAFEQDDLRPEMAAALDPSGSCFLALKAADRGLYQVSAVLARHSWKNGSGLIRKKAAGICIDSLMNQGKLADAEFMASLAAAEYPESYSFRRKALEAEYWQQEDSAVIGSVDMMERFEESADDYELLLFSAVSSLRSGAEGWEDCWIRFFEYAPESDFIRRGWEYLNTEPPEKMSGLSSWADLMTGKYLMASGDTSGAEPLLAGFLQECAEGERHDFDITMLLSDLETAYIRLGRAGEGGEFFEKLPSADGIIDSSDSEYYFTAARLFRRAWHNRDALRMLDGYAEAGGELTDRILWYRTDLEIRLDPSAAAENIGTVISEWDDPGFFSDILDDLCTSLAAVHRWDLIADTALLLAEKGPVEAADRFGYISARAAELGFSSAPVPNRPYTDSYYRILSGSWIEPQAAEQSVPAVSGADSEPGAAEWITGLADFGLTGHLLPEIQLHRGELTEQSFTAAADAAAASGEWLESIRIMFQYPGELSREGMERLYPAAYRTEIESAAAAGGHPPWLIYGIVWKESGFEKDIVSRSGAIGLSQLMPSTAEEVAWRMGRTAGDLTDPVENLELGSWYLGWLMNYVGNNAAAVISYNGGPGRVRGWMRDFSGLPGDLFYETVPVAETHWYGKSVMTAALLYGWLYYDTEPDEGMKIIFPDFKDRITVRR